MKLKISNNLTLTLPPNTRLKAIEDYLTVENKDYFKQVKMLGYATRSWKFYRRRDTEFETIYTLPRGMAKKVVSLIGAKNLIIEYDLVGKWVEKPFKSYIKLRDYQKEVLETVEKKNTGIIVASVGSGKTVMACEIIYKKQIATTIIVPNNTLLNQWKNEIKKNLDYDVGIVNGKNKDIKDITVACVASLYNNADLLKKLVKNTGMLIYDECHTSVSSKARKVVQAFKPKYLYGLTATPYRGSDSFTPVLEFLFGEMLCDIKSDAPKPTVCAYKTNAKIPIREYPDMIKLMTENTGRNDLIHKTIFWEASISNRKTLVLTKRKEHAESLYKMCEDLDEFYIIKAEDPLRDFLLSGFKDGSIPFKCIIGTASLLSAGMDIPSLDTLVIACDIQSPVMLNQSSGRIMRLFEGKDDPKIIDFYDNENFILRKQFNERKKIYQLNGWDISFN